jgi:hypothetical protein
VLFLVREGREERKKNHRYLVFSFFASFALLADNIVLICVHLWTKKRPSLVMQESFRHNEKLEYVLTLQEQFIFIVIFDTIQVFTHTV